ncbi:MAG: methyltransferase domain-containing protein [Proteobacteria bacterium]|nr:methyltransferase domain-containing protein [Pseudomonadota bacterium]MBU4295955.1 methyltransferase domain-containing protein [Pseudomonadota bacterium]MCG2746165.1 methyltransferase domain-containing protein [Desulfobulbaceae bacterium]
MKASEVDMYNTIALGINAPVYAFYAGRILQRTGIRSGSCLDVGCGGGYLGLALARITDLDFIFFDQSPQMLHCAEENIADDGFSTRARTMQGKVQSIPLADSSVDLVVSRGSVPFWDQLPLAFGEINRVLKTAGWAYIGGGLGDPETRAATSERLRKEYPEWQKKHRRPPLHDNGHYASALTAAGIDAFSVTRNDKGMWITFRKQ